MIACWFVAVGLLGGSAPPPATSSPRARVVRFATYNASLNRETQGELARDLATPGDVQAGNVAEIIQRVRPDVLLMNEFDHDPAGRSASLFQDNYLSNGRNGAESIFYPFRFTVEVNTGVPSGADPLSRWVRMTPVANSDHRLVYLDLHRRG